VGGLKFTRKMATRFAATGRVSVTNRRCNSLSYPGGLSFSSLHIYEPAYAPDSVDRSPCTRLGAGGTHDNCRPYDGIQREGDITLSPAGVGHQAIICTPKRRIRDNSARGDPYASRLPGR
jgi:hypothetical protein